MQTIAPPPAADLAQASLFLSLIADPKAARERLEALRAATAEHAAREAAANEAEAAARKREDAAIEAEAAAQALFNAADLRKRQADKAIAELDAKEAKMREIVHGINSVTGGASS